MYKRKGLPDIGEFVVSTVKSTDQHSANFELDEFKNLEGTVTSSEMSRKWARNIRIFLKPGRKMICKVLKVDPHTHHIYLSIKRVGTSQAQTKQKEWNNEKRADDLMIALSKALNVKYDTILQKIGYPILDKYSLIYPFLLDILTDESVVDELKLDSKLSKDFIEIVRKRIKRRKIQITGILNLQSRASDGLLVIKDTLKTLKSEVEKSNNEITIKYLGAPKYKLTFKSTDLKRGEGILIDILQRIEKYIKKHDGSIEFQKSVN